MLGIIGTVPDVSFPLIHGPAILAGDILKIKDQEIPVNRGTPALIAASLNAYSSFNKDKNSVYAFLVGDTGKGEGSRSLYKYLVEHISEFNFSVLTFHYIQPDVDWHNRVFLTVEKMKKRPLMIADAGFMYAAKMSGQAPFYDFFTPDIGELAFLADEEAPHPFYTRGFILHQSDKATDLINMAYEHENAAKYLLVKGSTDYIVNNNEIIATMNSPSVEAMEAIGGTGDTITGMLSALCLLYNSEKAAMISAKANRLAGYYAKADPSTQVIDLIEKIPQAVKEAANEYSKL